MKKLSLFLSYLVSTLLLLIPTVVFGAEGAFVPLTNDLPSVIADQRSLPSMLNGLYTLSIALAAILAVIMIAIGGFEYMGSESYSSKEKGKERVRSALIGLGLILGAVLILNTINPNLTNMNVLERLQTPNALFATPPERDFDGALFTCISDGGASCCGSSFTPVGACQQESPQGAFKCQCR